VNKFQHWLINKRPLIINYATNGTATKHTETFCCHFDWLTMLLLASSTLCCLGSASFALTIRLMLVPDMLRYVASMTYANLNFTVLPGATALDTIHRTRLLRDIRVRVGDIARKDDNIGKVAFVAADKQKVQLLNL
jgi:hypothetical protein